MGQGTTSNLKVFRFGKWKKQNNIGKRSTGVVLEEIAREEIQ